VTPSGRRIRVPRRRHIGARRLRHGLALTRTGVYHHAREAEIARNRPRARKGDTVALILPETDRAFMIKRREIVVSRHQPQALLRNGRRRAQGKNRGFASTCAVLSVAVCCGRPTRFSSFASLERKGSSRDDGWDSSSLSRAEATA